MRLTVFVVVKKIEREFKRKCMQKKTPPLLQKMRGVLNM